MTPQFSLWRWAREEPEPCWDLLALFSERDTAAAFCQEAAHQWPAEAFAVMRVTDGEVIPPLPLPVLRQRAAVVQQLERCFQAS